jgi:hypothetical protein
MSFTPGQSGNPAGRAVGGRNKQTLAAEARLFEHAQELVDNLVTRANRGEPAAMRLAMDRILPTGRGRPLPIELPPVRSTEDAQAAVGVIMDALKAGALSAREAVDLINVVTALTRLNGTIELIKKMARREVAKVAQSLGIDHFDPGPRAEHDYFQQMAEMHADEDEAGQDAEDEPYEENGYRSGQEADMPPGDGLQIVADSERSPHGAKKCGDSICANGGRGTSRPVIAAAVQRKRERHCK